MNLSYNRVMPKILATDLDGTLFYPRRFFGMICRKNLKMVRRFIDEGNILLIVSGRNYLSGLRVAKRIDRKVVLLGCNSSLICEDNKLISDTCFNNEELKQFLNYIDDTFKPKTYVLMTDKDNLLMYCKRIRFFTKLFYPVWAFAQGSYYEPFRINKKDYLYQLDHNKIYKVMIFLGVGKKAKAFASIANKYINANKPFCESSWTASSLELTPFGINKASGILKYIESKGYSKNDVYVVGDGGNDIVMFKEFYEHSFCMKHGMASVGKYAKHIINKYTDLEKFLFEENK